MTGSDDRLHDLDWAAAHQPARRRPRFLVWWQLVAILIVVVIVHVLDR